MTYRTQPRVGPDGGPGRLEPRLQEVLRDPIVRTLMARDGVGLGDIRYLIDLVRGLQDRGAGQERAA